MLSSGRRAIGSPSPYLVSGRWHRQFPVRQTAVDIALDRLTSNRQRSIRNDEDLRQESHVIIARKTSYFGSDPKPTTNDDHRQGSQSCADTDDDRVLGLVIDLRRRIHYPSHGGEVECGRAVVLGQRLSVDLLTSASSTQPGMDLRKVKRAQTIKVRRLWAWVST
jgi:hypothetical protein